MNLSVDVAGVVVTMSPSSVNADCGYDMVGGGGFVFMLMVHCS